MIIIRWIDAVSRLGLYSVAMVVTGAAMTPAQAGPEMGHQQRLENGEVVKVEPRFQSLIEGKKVLSIVRVVIAPDVTEHRHRHPGLEIVYVLNGSGSIHVEARHRPFEQGRNDGGAGGCRQGHDQCQPILWEVIDNHPTNDISINMNL